MLQQHETRRNLAPTGEVHSAGAMPAAWNPEDLGEQAERLPSNAPNTVEDNRRISARRNARIVERTREMNEPCRQDAALGQNAEALQVRLAETAWEHLRAFHLVYEQYAPFGYDGSRVNRLRIQPWNLTPRSHTLIAERNDQVVGTVTCLEDGTDGFPADKVYPEEIRRLREQGRRLIEMSSFAVESKNDTDADIVLQTLRAAVTYCRKELKATDWICTVNPRHERFYVKVMLFEKLGGIADCHAVNDAPTVFLRLNLETLPERYAQRYGTRRGPRNLYDFFFERAAEERRIAQLRAAAERRSGHWPITQKALALLQD
jgi:hypothetical protein